MILGCTEIELLVGQADSPVPVFPTTRIHAELAVDYALGLAEPPEPGSSQGSAGRADAQRHVTSTT